MTTPRIEEMVEKICEFDFENKLWSDSGYNEFKDLLRRAFTEAHQAGIDEAVEIIKEELRNAPLEVQMTKGVIFGKVIKALQDTNSRDSMLSNKEAN